MSKPTRVTTADIRTLETIYADGRAMGRMVNDLKAELASLRAENAALKTEVRTLTYRLKRVTALHERGAVQNGATPACKPGAGVGTLRIR